MMILHDIRAWLILWTVSNVFSVTQNNTSTTMVDTWLHEAFKVGEVSPLPTLFNMPRGLKS